MKIDLHCHTKCTKKGDGIGRNVTKELFRNKILCSDVKIVAITNHNAFDYTQYQELKLSVEDACQLWPGIEIDIKGYEDKKYHLIVVANPDNVEEFNQKVALLYHGKDIETCLLNIEEVYNSLNDCDIIYIPHFHKKPGISEEDREKLLNLVKDPTRIFGETADNRSLGVFANHDYNVIIGSDVKDWTQYEQSTFAELKLPVSSFSQFCLLAKRDHNVVNTLLNQKRSYTLNAKPHESVNIELTVYEDVNIIFGQKGTGKSEILKTLYNSLNEQGVACQKYIGTETNKDFDLLLKTMDMSMDVSKVSADECEEEFELLQSWTDVNPTLFSNYINWYNTKDNNRHKSQMKITDTTTLMEATNNEIELFSTDKEYIKNAINNLEKIDYKHYIDEQDSKELLQLIQILSNQIDKKLFGSLCEKYSIYLTNYSINKIKSIADKNSNSVSKPSTTGFKEFVQKRLELKKTLEKIFDNIDSKEYQEKVYLGELENKGKIYIGKMYRMLCEKSLANEFTSGIRILKNIKRKLVESINNINNSTLVSLLDELNSLCKDNNIDSTKYFLGLSKKTVTEDGEEYVPSNGEKGILLLQKLLKSDADAYFLDEPELGMGNSYMDAIIRPEISGLAKRHKAVIIATHNANIAVRTLPYTSIFRTHENGKYATYIGNPFNDKLINIEDEQDVRSWSFESLHTLEGGREAFEDRRNIYESNNGRCSIERN